MVLMSSQNIIDNNADEINLYCGVCRIYLKVKGVPGVKNTLDTRFKAPCCLTEIFVIFVFLFF